jgi:hypothetical protein
MIKKIILFILLVWPQIVGSSQGTLTKALPKDGDVEGWKRHRPQQHYEGEDLYEYINGGAEIYHEYGFVRVAIQDYVDSTGKSISVEIYEMASPTSAYGIYTFKTSTKGKRIAVGNDAQLADYYMNFWKGPFLVTLTGFDKTEKTRQGLLAIAQAVSSRMLGGGVKPSVVSLLPGENLVAQSVKYFTGFLGLRNSHPFFNLSVMGYVEGVKGDYTGDFSLFLFRFDGEQESRKAYQSIKGQKDRRGRQLFAATHSEYLMLVLGDADQQRAEQIFDRAREKIHEHD